MPAAETDATPRPLAGIRVLDLAVVWAGPFATQILADLGAEVIKVENVHVWQPMTRGAIARPRKEDVTHDTVWPLGFPDDDPADCAWERDPWTVPLLRNKKSVTINTRSPKGLEYVYRLVAKCDVVVENNVPETVEKLHMTYEELTVHRPDLIMVRMPAFGLTGPYKNRRGLGTHIEAFIGHTGVRGYADSDPTTNSMIFAGDYHNGSIGAFAVMAALRHRDLTGEGQLIELAQAESSAHLLPQALMDFAMNGRAHSTIGNRDVHGYAPNGVFRCRGDDRWIAITVSDDQEWAALCDVAGRADLVCDARFASTTAREAHQDELEAVVEAFTRTQDATALMYRLQRAGVPAGAVMDGRDALGSPQLWARGYFERFHHRFTGSYEWPGPPIRVGTTPPSTPPAGLGEHNEYVYKELIGVGDAEYEDLVQRGEIGTVFDADIP